MSNLSNIARSALIGLKVKVVQSTNPSYIGLFGKVIDETKNTFTILCNNEEKVLIKEACTFHFVLPDQSVIEIEGKVLIGRPEDRVKKVVRRRW